MRFIVAHLPFHANDCSPPQQSICNIRCTKRKDLVVPSLNNITLQHPLQRFFWSCPCSRPLSGRFPTQNMLDMLLCRGGGMYTHVLQNVPPESCCICNSDQVGHYSTIVLRRCPSYNMSTSPPHLDTEGTRCRLVLGAQQMWRWGLRRFSLCFFMLCLVTLCRFIRNHRRRSSCRALLQQVTVR